MVISRNIPTVANYLKRLKTISKYPLVRRYPVKGIIDVNKDISGITAAPHRHITRWNKNIGIGSLCANNVGFEDISIILPKGDSKRYVEEIKRFVIEVFGQSPKWAERDNFLDKLQPEVRLDGLRCLLQHPFLCNPAQRSQSLRNFVEFYKHKRITIKRNTSHLSTTFTDWEMEYFPENKYAEGIAIVCKKNPYTKMVYHYWRLSNATTNVPSYCGIEKVRISRNIIVHLNDHAKHSGCLYSDDEIYSLVEELFPGIFMMVYDFRWEMEWDGDIRIHSDHLLLL